MTMSHTDLLVEGFPHGTPEGYDRGCHGSGCPAHAEHGLSCKIAKAKSKGDYEYQKLARAGATPAAIADALGLIGTEPGAPVAKPKTMAPRNPKALDIEDVPPAVEVQPEPREVQPVPLEVQPDASAMMLTEKLARRTTEDATKAPEPPRMNGPRAERSTIATGNASGNTEPAANPSAAGSATSREIRAWAIAKGYDVKPRGTLPRFIIDHYWEATGRLDAPAPKTDAPESTPAAPAPDSEDLVLPTYVTDVLGPFITESEPTDEPRPEWGDVALAEDLEAARALAVRLEQELARSEEQREADREQHAVSLRAADDLVRGIMRELGAAPDEAPVLAAAGLMARYLLARAEAERTSDELSEALAAAQAGEAATQLALQKWAAERAASRIALEVIALQAKRIDELNNWDKFTEALRRLEHRTAVAERTRGPFRPFVRRVR